MRICEHTAKMWFFKCAVFFNYPHSVVIIHNYIIITLTLKMDLVSIALHSTSFTSMNDYKNPYSCVGVKSFLERFGERCQERNDQTSSAGGATQAKTPSVTPSAVTPNTRMVQERLRAAQALNTTTADLTQRQKLVRLC